MTSFACKGLYRFVMLPIIFNPETARMQVFFKQFTQLMYAYNTNVNIQSCLLMCMPVMPVVCHKGSQTYHTPLTLPIIPIVARFIIMNTFREYVSTDQLFTCKLFVFRQGLVGPSQNCVAVTLAKILWMFILKCNLHVTYILMSVSAKLRSE